MFSTSTRKTILPSHWRLIRVGSTLSEIHIFTDRDGDSLDVITRDISEGGNAIPDPVISITEVGGLTKSIVMNDNELVEVMTRLAEVFDFDISPKSDRY